MSTTSPHPFGSYFPAVLTGDVKAAISAAYDALLAAPSFDAFATAAVGFRRTLVLYDPKSEQVDNAGDEEADQKSGHIVAKFPDEIIPVVIIACKAYIDATRLENVIAKATNLSIQHARCTYLVVAEWDALGQGWHDERGRVIDSQYAPISRIIFLRGNHVRRPTGAKRQVGHTDSPYLREHLTELYDAIRTGIAAWIVKA